MDDFIRIIYGLLSNPISAFFCYFILGWLFLALVFVIFSSLDNQRIKALVDLTPQALTTLGILGTFTGVFLGLLDFDIRTINKSVPALIEGLKVAFGTSILGLFSALIFKVMHPILSKEAGSDEVTGQDLIGALDAIKKALSDDSDRNVVGQLQGLREDVVALKQVTSNGFGEQVKEFKQFAEHMSKAFSDAIINELRDVIREFNQKMSEQFGENFKQLNEAVGKLLEWQKDYKRQMEEMKEALETSLEAIRSSEKSLVNIEEAANAIPQHMEGLAEINDRLVAQITQMHDGLSSIAEMRERAENAIPEISAKIKEMTTTISSSVDLQRKTVENVKSAVETSAGKMQSAVEGVGKNIEDSLGKQREAQKKMLDGLESTLNSTLQTATHQLNDAVVQLDEAMQREIGSVVRTMAENLSGVTQQFVKDYTPLLEQSRKIVELSKEANSQ